MSLVHPQLLAFAAVVEEGSFEAAATRLSLTPSAVSQRIKALEERLGQVVVVRSAPCRPTEAGERLLRSVQQMRLLDAETLASFAPDAVTGAQPIALAVNADSLASWFMPALAELYEQYGLYFDVRVEDQDHSAGLLRDGTVLGAVTAEARPVQGCVVERLGVMRYLPVAAPAFVARWFGGGVNAASLGQAPMLIFNRKDALQWRFMRQVTRAHMAPPVHYLPSATAFVEGAARGLGWAMAPECMLGDALRGGALCPIGAGLWLDVPLYWQHWSIRSATLARVSAALMRAAARDLPERAT